MLHQTTVQAMVVAVSILIFIYLIWELVTIYPMRQVRSPTSSKITLHRIKQQDSFNQ